MMKNTTKSWCVVATEDLKSKRLRNGFKYSRLCLVWKAFSVPWIGIASGGTFSHSYNVCERDCIRFTERIDRMVFVQGVRAVSEKVNCSSLLLLLLPPPPPTTTTTDEAATKTHNTQPQQNQRINESTVVFVLTHVTHPQFAVSGTTHSTLCLRYRHQFALPSRGITTHRNRTTYCGIRKTCSSRVSCFDTKNGWIFGDPAAHTDSYAHTDKHTHAVRAAC